MVFLKENTPVGVLPPCVKSMTPWTSVRGSRSEPFEGKKVRAMHGDGPEFVK